MRPRPAFAAVASALCAVAVFAAGPYGARIPAVVASAHGRIAASADTPATARPGSRLVITGGNVGIPQDRSTWPTSTWGPGDTWYNTWAANGDIYATSDDSGGFDNNVCVKLNGHGGNFIVNELTGDNPSTLSASYTNCMTSYGHEGDQQSYHDGYTWKTDGVISVDGALYVVVDRQDDATGGWPNGFQPSDDASIIKSTDGGRTWSNSFGATGDPNGAVPPPLPDGKPGAEAMFPGSSFATPQFIQYGQDDNPASTADGGNQYVYAVSNDGFAYDGSYLILGRAVRAGAGVEVH